MKAVLNIKYFIVLPLLKKVNNRYIMKCTTFDADFDFEELCNTHIIKVNFIHLFFNFLYLSNKSLVFLL